MSSHGTLVEPCIYRRPGGTYRARVYHGGVAHEESFKRLKEARAFKNKIRKGRIPLPDSAGLAGGNYLSSDQAESKQERKRLIREARKHAEIVFRDGREWKLVRL